MKSFKEIDKEFGDLKKDINISEKYPKWINKKISRLWLVFVFLLLLTAFASSGWDGTFLEYKCSSSQGCLNPFYNMTEGVEGFSCDELMCDSPVHSLGVEFDNSPPFVDNFFLILFGSFFLIFPISRVIYMLKNGE